MRVIEVTEGVELDEQVITIGNHTLEDNSPITFEIDIPKKEKKKKIRRRPKKVGDNRVIWVVRRPVATWMIAIALLVFGWVSYQRLPLNLMPDLSYPTITVRTAADGYAPEEVESQVSQRIEEVCGDHTRIVETRKSFQSKWF